MSKIYFPFLPQYPALILNKGLNSAVIGRYSGRYSVLEPKRYDAIGFYPLCDTLYSNI